MNVILEGPDGGGKSTLAAFLSEHLGMPVQQGSGPPRRRGEIEDRLAHYLTIDGHIFDRHPAVSQPIYGALRGETPSTEFTMLTRSFYSTKSVLVYCRATSPEQHVVKEGENPEHVRILTMRYQDLVGAYDAWALRHAHVIYRMGDSMPRIADAVRGLRA